MKFRISISPDPNRWPIGQILSLAETAQLLEIEATELAARSDMEPVIREQGFRLRAIPESLGITRQSRSTPKERLARAKREFEAIAFLRALIHQPAEWDGGAGRNFGWCALEHARAAQIALRAVGEDARLALGTLAFFNDDDPNADFQVANHRFLLLHRSDMAIFDSAATFPGVDGVAPQWQDRYRDLKVLAFEGEPDEAGWAIRNDPERTPMVACYFVHEERELSRDSVSLVMDTPFCEWIEEEFGGQERLWGNVIGTTIRILTGEPHGAPIPFHKKNQVILWDWLQSQPDDREFIDVRLRG